MTNDIFRECRERVTAEAVARFYGFEPNRAGFISCPFHHEKTASLKLYPGAKGFYCFGCHTGGSVVDFVARLFGLEPLEAAKRLNADFHLDLQIDRPQGRTEAAARRELSNTSKAFESWRSVMLDKLTAVFRKAHLALKTPDDLTEAECLAIRWQSAAEHWADCLMSDDLSVQMGVFRDREEVTRLCNMILKSSPTKSGAA